MLCACVTFMKSGSQWCGWRRGSLCLLSLLWLYGILPALQAQPVEAHVVPPSVIAPLASSVHLCVETTGAGLFTYQWQKNGVNLTGQTNPCLDLAEIAIGDGGSYRATVSSPEGGLVSEEGVVVIGLKLLPGADPFSKGTPIAAVSNSVRGVLFGSTREPGEPMHFGLSTSNSVWYHWKAPGTGIATFDTRGSALDTVLSVYAGNDLTQLTELASDDDGGGFHTSRVSWNAEAGKEYQVAIDGVTGENGSYVCNWILEPTSERLPVITSQPKSQTVPAGGVAYFSVTATHPDPGLQFQWRRNGQILSGATSESLILENIDSSHLGSYQVEVRSSSGRSVLSAEAVLEIGSIPDVQSRDKLAELPPVDNPEGARRSGPQLMGLGASGSFSLSAGTVINQRFFNGSTVDRCEPAHCGVPGGASRWFQLVAASNGICTLDTQGSDVDTILAVYLQNSSICTKLYEPLVDCNNDVLGECDAMLAPNPVTNRSSRVSFSAIAGTVYRVVIDTVGGVRGTNVHFNVSYQAGPFPSDHLVQLDLSTNALLQMRGTSVTLKAMTHPSAPTNAYRWQINGRTIAGAVGDQLSLPFLNYSDAGRYTASAQEGSVQIPLGAVQLSIVSPCGSNPQSAAPGLQSFFPILGRASSPLVLEVTPALTPTSAWKTLGPIKTSVEPIVWNVSTGSSLFYRLLPSVP